MSTPILWKRFQQHQCRVPALGLTLDVSRMRFEDGFLDRRAAPMQRAFAAMGALERGAIANPDEKRTLGHYWLRAPNLAPSPEIAAEIRNTRAEIKRFAAAVHDGTIRTPAGVRLTHVLAIGIGGSALGPMFVADALGNPASDRMKLDFIDNTDPDGIARTLAGPAGRLLGGQVEAPWGEES
jgi:glucose-6-phosphate isomerase